MSGRSGLPPPPRGGGATLSPEEFAELFSAASATLWYIAAGVLGGRSEAEDVLQEAAAIGLRKLGEFDRSTSFAAWMGEIVRNVARNSARKHARRQTTPWDPAIIDQSRSGTENGRAAALSATGDLLPEDASFDDRVLAALRTLEENARVCLLLRVLADLSYAEISRVLSIPEGTAMSHVHRARKALRERLGESGAPGTDPAGGTS